MEYCRTDLCPDCGTRLNLDTRPSPDWQCVMVDYPMLLEYKGDFYTTIKCGGCPALWTKPGVLDFWATHLQNKGSFQPVVVV